MRPGRIHIYTQTLPERAQWSAPLPGGGYVAAVASAPYGSVLPTAAQKIAVADEGFNVVQFYPDVSIGDASGVLASAGVRRLSHPNLLPNEYVVEATHAQISALGGWDEVAKVYPASADLVEGTPVQNCNGGAFGTSQVAALLSTPVAGAWKTTDLTWSLRTLPDGVARDVFIAAVERALAAWSDVSPLRFTRTIRASAVGNIEFLVATGGHGDDYPFPSGVGVLAHTFYPAPLNPEPIAGDVHLNASHAWTSVSDPELFSVLVHEIGHAIGLMHSDRPASVMYPYYRKLSVPAAEDVEALSTLYPTATNPRPTQPTTPLADTPDPLALDINAPESTTATTIEVSGTVTGGRGATLVDWSTNGATGTATGGRTWQAVGVPVSPGLNGIVFTATDSTGSTVSRTLWISRTASTESSPATPSADRVAPSLFITYPPRAVFATAASTVRISGTARDNSGIAEVVWQRGGTSGVAEGTSYWQIDLPLLVGDNSVIVRARDNAGNSTWRSLMVTRR